GAPGEGGVEAEDGAALVAEEADHAGYQAQLEVLSELEIPANQGRAGSDGFIVVAELEVERPVICTGVDYPEVLRTRREVPEERDPERPRRFHDRLRVHGPLRDRRRPRQQNHKDPPTHV